MLNPLRDEPLLWLGRDTAGAVHLDDCRAVGVTDDKLAWLVASGRWQPLFPRTYAAFSGPVPLPTRMHAAVLYAGLGAVVSHESAGFEQGLCAQPDLIHLTVGYERDADDQPGLRVHRSRTLDEAQIDPSGSPPRTRVERTVVDLLAGRRSADAALGLVTKAISSRRTTATRVRRCLAEHPCTKWARVVREALPDVGAGAHSALELRDARLRRAHGLPTGTRQFKRLAGGAEYLDLVVEEWQLHVELDGRLGHDSATDAWRDMRRDNRSERLRLRHLRYGWSDLVDRPCEVAIEQAVILRQQGWPGPFRRCPRCPTVLPAGL
jgi:hypothetical protein